MILKSTDGLKTWIGKYSWKKDFPCPTNPLLSKLFYKKQ
jgi:hypothetical protein